MQFLLKGTFDELPLLTAWSWRTYHFPTGAPVIPGERAAGEFAARARQGQFAAAAAAARVDGSGRRQTQLAQTLGHG